MVNGRVIIRLTVVWL